MTVSYVEIKAERVPFPQRPFTYPYAVKAGNNKEDTILKSFPDVTHVRLSA
jgi:hypothetical protein